MKKSFELKSLFLERMKKLLPEKEDFENYLKTIKEEPLASIRCNTLKISPEGLKKILEEKGWKIFQPFKKNPEILIIEGKFVYNENKKMDSKKNLVNDNLANKKIYPNIKNNHQSTSEFTSGCTLIPLGPGELGSSLEHVLGYYYIQDVASMLPIISLAPKPNDLILDLCASPGSKTSQIATEMKNKGTIIANDFSLQRIRILASNLERCGVLNTIITRKEGADLCKKFLERGFLFDKILVDAPCSGEGTIKSSEATARMWNINAVRKLSGIQKNLLQSALQVLKKDGEIVYSTCTHAPEENEEVVDFVLKKFKGKIKIEKISLPVKYRSGLSSWNDKKYNKELTKTCRIYPQDNDTEGFFIAKIRRVK